MSMTSDLESLALYDTEIRVATRDPSGPREGKRGKWSGINCGE